jgi:hypothetical protein
VFLKTIFFIHYRYDITNLHSKSTDPKNFVLITLIFFTCPFK